jgi:uncharacterized repeat protein (TIGR01451 family)
MSIFSLFSVPSERAPKTPRKKRANNLFLEALEDRSVPSTSPLAGPGGATQGDAANTQVATGSVGAQGASLTKTVTFASTPTDFALQGMLDQFNPSLGTLQSIEVTHAGSITSQIQVENTSTASTSHISGTISGTLDLQGPSGVNDSLSLSQYAGSFDASKYDGTTDYQGLSGTSFGVKAANGSDNFTLNGNQLAPYIGTGQVTLTEAGQATSNATGGGNLNTQITSTGQATVTVVYNYLPPTGAVSGFVYHDANDNGTFEQASEQGIPSVTVTLTGTDVNNNAVNLTALTDNNGAYQFTGLSQGNYTVTMTQPAGWIETKAAAGSLGGNASGTIISQISLPQNGQTVNNDFGEIKLSSLAGTVYYDVANTGSFQAGDPGIQGATVTLSGFNSSGPVSASTTTDPNGNYSFTGLLPGTYGISETQPAGYLQGTNTLGSQGGNLSGDQVTNIALPDSTQATHYNFGEVKPPPQSDDLAIVKTASAQVSNYGDQLVYTLHITNNGPDAAQQVVVTDNLPSDVQVQSVSAPGWDKNLSGSTLILAQPTFAAGAVSDVLVTVKVPSTTENLTNTVVISSQTPDTNPNNNNSQVTTAVQSPPTVPQTPVPTNIQGTPVPQAPLAPLQTHLPVAPIVSKSQLFTDTAKPYVDPAAQQMYTFVDGVYQTLTGQSADPATEAAAVTKLQNGLSRQEFVYDVWNSDAHLSREINNIYQTVLDRGPSGNELSSGIQSLRGNQAIGLTAQLLTSAEFQQLHPSSASLSVALSQTILGQNPGTTSEQSLAQSLDAQPLGTVVQSMLYSHAALSQAVSAAYLQTLRRQPSAAEIQYWSGQIASGATSAEGLAESLLASNEFYQLAYNAAV